VALIVPHAAWRYSGAAAAAAFRNLKRGDFSRVVLVAPSHRGSFEGYSVDDASAYRTPLGDIPLDARAVSELSDGKLVREVRGVAAAEHAVEIELPFLQETLVEFQLVPILAGLTNADQERDLARRLAKLHDGKTLFVFSSDFAHYGRRFGFEPFGPTPAALPRIRELDGRAIDHLSRIDAEGFRKYLQETGNTICGRAGLRVLLELLPLIAPKAEAVLLDQYASGEMQGTGDDSSVSYVSMAYTLEAGPEQEPLGAPPRYTGVPPDATALDDATGRRLVRLARATLRTRLAGSHDLSTELGSFPKGPLYERLQGVFVTLYRKDPAEIARKGKLRGCIGQVTPRMPLYEAVVHAAVSAALLDRRFTPVLASELDRLEVEVTALMPPAPIGSWRDIEIGKHGIVLEKNGRSALFLPQVAVDQGWNIEQTLSALARKAGLPKEAWREGASFSVFTGQVFKEGESS
jgi:AmmeMemoRadiSam system protein B/AmmeMemoRadiSam system protein A